MYLEQGIGSKNGRNMIGLYLLGFVLVLSFTQLGSIPLILEMRSLIEPQHFSNNWMLFWMTSSFAIALLVLYCWMNFVHLRPLTSLATSRKKIDWKRVRFSIAIQGILMLATFAYSFYTSKEDLVWQFQFESFVALFFISIVFLSIQSALEELLFRGYLLQGIATEGMYRMVPMIITASIFGCMHLGNPEVAKHGSILLLYYIGFGLFSSLWAIMDEGLELSMGAHIANNVLTVLLICSPESALQTDSLFKSTVPLDVPASIIGFYVGAILLTLIFAWRYKWTDWGKIVRKVGT